MFCCHFHAWDHEYFSKCIFKDPYYQARLEALAAASKKTTAAAAPAVALKPTPTKAAAAPVAALGRALVEHRQLHYGGCVNNSTTLLFSSGSWQACFNRIISVLMLWLLMALPSYCQPNSEWGDSVEVQSAIMHSWHKHDQPEEAAILRTLIAPLTTTAVNIPDTEMQALRDLYNATNGEQWKWLPANTRNGYPWIFTAVTAVNENPCTKPWQGITCLLHKAKDPYYHVSKLKLIARKLTGTISCR